MIGGAAILTGVLAILGQAVGASAKFHHMPKDLRPTLPRLPGAMRMPSEVAKIVKDKKYKYYNGTFEQPIDHWNPEIGTFQNRFWFDTTHWKGPGSPVFMAMVGEDNGELGIPMMYEALPALYAKEFGGMTIVFEHRYFGESVPYDHLDSETLQYLQLPQSMMDVVSFAANASFDLGNGHMNDNASAAPWVLMGGSYPGAMVGWINQVFPGTFWAYHSSSGVVQTITDFYQYFEPIANGMPTNCSADVRAVVNYVDSILTEGIEDKIYRLKASFGLQNLDHNDDFAAALGSFILQWQDDPAAVFEFCDYLETGTDPDSNITTTAKSYPNGVGLNTALLRYGRLMRSAVADGGKSSNTYDDAYSKAVSDPKNFGSDRMWDWLICDNPFGWFQVGGGDNGTMANTVGLISSFNNVDHWLHICDVTFPRVNAYEPGILTGFTPEQLNLFTRGWNGNFTNTIFVNGGVDPWRSATVSSDYRPSGPLLVADDIEVVTVPSGDHCPEFWLKSYPEMPDLYKSLLLKMDLLLLEYKKVQQTGE